MAEDVGFVDLRVRLSPVLADELRRRTPDGVATGAYARTLVREQLAAGAARRQRPPEPSEDGQEFRFKVTHSIRRELRVRAARLDTSLQALCAALLQAGLDAARAAPRRGASALPSGPALA